MPTEGEENDQEDGSAEDQGDGKGQQDPPKSFKQEDVDDIAARVRSKTRRQVTGEILDAFGVESLEELKATFAKLKTAKKGAAPAKGAADDEEATAALEAANKRADKAEAALAKLEGAAFEVRKREAVMLYGNVGFEQAKRIGKMLEVEPDADDDELKADVRRLTRELPLLFKTPDQGEDDEGDGAPPPPTPRPSSSGNPGRGPRAVRKPEDARTAATSRLHLRHPQLKDKK